MSQLKKIVCNCKEEAIFLIERRMMGQITFREYIELRMHLFGCSECTLYGKQSRILNNMTPRIHRATPISPFRLDDSFK